MALHLRRCTGASDAERAHFRQHGKWPPSEAEKIRNRTRVQRWKRERRARRPIH